MRKLAVLLVAAAGFFALVAFAFASGTPTVTYKSPIKESSKPKPHKPANISYTGILDVKESDGTQPPTGWKTTLYFAKQFITNGKHFPSCSVKDIDGKQKVPSKCKKAVIGSGTAQSEVGSPGTPPALTVNPISVTAYNGPKGKQILLDLNYGGTPQVVNRVIPGKLGKGGGPFGYTVTFIVPKDLQSQLNLQIALTHFNVTIPPKKTVKVRGRRVSYLQLVSCPKSKKLPVKAKVFFNKDDGTHGGPTVTATSTTRCK